MTLGPTHVPTRSPTQDYSNETWLLLCFVVFVLFAIITGFCSFLGHARNTAYYHRKQWLAGRKTMKKVLDELKIPYEDELANQTNAKR